MSGHVHKDYIGAKFGMWLFLFTEVLLFGGLFILYAVYLARYPQEFISAGGELDVRFGGGNTLVLLTSSLFVAISITALRCEKVRLAMGLLGATIGCAALFMINKYFEWTAKFSHGIYPGSEHFADMKPGEMVFFNIYYLTTGLHGIHVVIGAIILAWTMCLIRSGRVNAKDWVILENAGLYWHLVDLIWIFIFPLYYLVLH
ncbi:MAG: cytochrome c oxidase subunit 3 family protein [Deltaproteobacteria bacterium]|jgi:cytochrome c oxidase subunit 3|nr:cytochrome c oxidase subunit 3 family protein [Deltaproteobacteria bacterium]